MRDSNMELCRLVSMLLIVMLHTGFQTFGVPTNLSEVSISLLLMQSFCNVGVDVFILLTGFYSAQLKTKSFVNLAYICFFYAIVSVLIGFFSHQQIPCTKALFITKSNWFIPSYICLLAFAPFVNKACENLSKKELMGGGILIGLTLTWFGWLPALPTVSIGSNNGCSVVSFLFLYIIGRYIRLYGLPKFFVKYSIIIYILCSIAVAAMAYTILHYGQGYSGKMNAIIQRVYANNNPVVIISALSFFCFFLSIKLKNSTAINYIAKSTLAVLLLHASGQFSYYMKPYFINLYDNFNGLSCAVFWLISVLIIGVIAVAIDQIRLVSYKFISRWFNKGVESLVSFIDNKL